MSEGLFERQRRNRAAVEDPALGLLLRVDADWYAAILFQAFEGLPERVEKSVFMDRLVDIANEMIDARAFPTRLADREWQRDDAGELAGLMYRELLNPTQYRGRFGWIRVDADLLTKEVAVSRTWAAYRAQEILDGIASNRRELTGARLESFTESCIKLVKTITTDRASLILGLKSEILERQAEIERLEAGGSIEESTHLEVHEQLENMDQILEQMPAAGHRLAEHERANGTALLEKLRSLSLELGIVLDSYVADTASSFEKSEDGQSFKRAERVLRDELFDETVSRALKLVRMSTYADAESLALLGSIDYKLDQIAAAVKDVSMAVCDSMETVMRLAQRTGRAGNAEQARQAERLRLAYSAWAADSKGTNPATPVTVPYGGKRRRSFATSAASVSTEAPKPLADAADSSANAQEAMRLAARYGAPRPREVLGAIMRDPVMFEDKVDVAASFNRLPDDLRLIQEMAGLLLVLGADESAEEPVVWETVDAQGVRQLRASYPVLLSPDSDILATLEEAGAL